jgi:hypothetical protein
MHSGSLSPVSSIQSPVLLIRKRETLNGKPTAPAGLALLILLAVVLQGLAHSDAQNATGTGGSGNATDLMNASQSAAQGTANESANASDTCLPAGGAASAGPGVQPAQTIGLAKAEIHKAWHIQEGGSEVFEFLRPHNFGELQYVLIRDAGAYDVAYGDFSMGAWIRTSAEDAGTIITKGSYEEGKYYTLGVNGEGTLFFGMGDSSRNVWVETSDAFNDGRWHHVISVRNATGAAIYVDGEEAASIEAEPLNLSNKGVLGIGADMSDYDWSQAPRTQFAGGIKDPAIWRRALGGDEIKKLFEEGR